MLEYWVFVKHDIFLIVFYCFLLCFGMYSDLCFGRNNQILSSGYYFLISAYISSLSYSNLGLLQSCRTLLNCFYSSFIWGISTYIISGLLESVLSIVLYNTTNVNVIHYLLTYIFISNKSHCYIFQREKCVHVVTIAPYYYLKLYTLSSNPCLYVKLVK